MFLIMIGLIVGLVLGGGLVFIVMWSLGGSEAMQIVKARMSKRSRLFEIHEPNGRFHLVCVKRDDEAPFYNIKKYATIVPNPTTAANIRPKRGEKGLEIWECVPDTPLLVDLPAKIATTRCLEICREEHPELGEFSDRAILSLLTTKHTELMHDCEAVCGRGLRPSESVIHQILRILDSQPPEVWEDAVNALDDELKRVTEEGA